MDWINTDSLAILALGIWIGYMGGRLTPGDRKVRKAIHDEQVARLIDRLTPQGLARIADSLAQKRKIEAIKFFREETNAGLVDARSAVETLRRNNPQGLTGR